MIPVVVVERAEEAASVVAAVGQSEEALALVRCADVGRGEQVPFRIEPEVGKIAKNLGEPKRNVASDVLDEEEGSLGFSEDPQDVRP